MNKSKLDRLFASARKAISPSPKTGLDTLVLSAIRREGRRADKPVSLLDQLGELFPRLAWATALVVALCVAADFGLGALGVPDLTEGVVQVSEQWLFTANGF